jgi:hypothetical protein
VEARKAVFGNNIRALFLSDRKAEYAKIFYTRAIASFNGKRKNPEKICKTILSQNCSLMGLSMDLSIAVTESVAVNSEGRGDGGSGPSHRAAASAAGAGEEEEDQEDGRGGRGYGANSGVRDGAVNMGDGLGDDAGAGTGNTNTRFDFSELPPLSAFVYASPFFEEQLKAQIPLLEKWGLLKYVKAVEPYIVLGASVGANTVGFVATIVATQQLKEMLDK